MHITIVWYIASYNALVLWQTDTVCDLYGKIREKWKYLSKDRFRLKHEVKEISPNYGNLQLDDWNVNLRNRSTIFVIFPTPGGTIG